MYGNHYSKLLCSLISWRKKKDGETVNETHEKMKVKGLCEKAKDILVQESNVQVGGIEKVYEIGRIFRNEVLQLVIILNSPPLRRYCDTMCPWPLAVNGKLRIDYQGVEICLERPWRRETMHNLVKEAGIDFKNFGDDLNAAKEHDIKQLIFLVMIWIRVQLKHALLLAICIMRFLRW
ncbi:uncharacterized protein [Solanum tuberosum]|uniref:uncharacterized protein isoform X2 n=1 Tax=Solanum tuberosum TaxID=4113 RepID=UPI00073A0E22|nr:PREDICTED: uncharacterized protein LOC102590864 isoform X2 [Solanum tuberosum]